MHKSLVTRQPIGREVSLIYRGDTIRCQARGKIHKTGDADKSPFSRRAIPCHTLPKREENDACHRQEHIGKILERTRLCGLKKRTTKLARRNDNGPLDDTAGHQSTLSQREYLRQQQGGLQHRWQQVSPRCGNSVSRGDCLGEVHRNTRPIRPNQRGDRQ